MILPESPENPSSYHDEYVRAHDAGRYVLPHCVDCDHLFWHPRRHCPRCMSTRLELVEPDRSAHVHSYTVNRRPRGGGVDPLILAYVEVADGLRVLAELDVDVDRPVIGLEVRPRFRVVDGSQRVVFVAAGGGVATEPPSQ